VTFDHVPLCIICVRLGPSTPGDYVRARVLVPRNPGVTHTMLEGQAVLQIMLAFTLHERDLLLEFLSPLLLVPYHLAHLGLRRDTLALGLEDLFLLLEVAVLDAQGPQL
jgi:hypothetical protein